ncbi:alpha/beta hydrolase [Aliiruegeria sabulilitoris]|uniref:alpha/beta hydrolase n=1 Tax=Aliiruegeria sabulilitoris TaxID=1510458 RepID=UPI0008378DA6|nr:alpha/beta hydrolase [Aliiruegeria sabulilitoris]NDR56820.1 alpha/beta fold hydrolase [Pseudoruegeria sp. M32A2M]
MHIKPLLLCFLVSTATVLPFVANAQGSDGTPFDPIAFELEMSGLETDAARVAAIDAAIAALETSPTPDFQVYFDLFTLKLEILQAGGDLRATADMAAELGAFALSRGEALGRNPLPYFDLAADLYEQAGAPDAAIGALEAGLKYRLDGGQSGDSIAAIYRDMARLAEVTGQKSAAESYLAQAQAALDPDAVGTRADETAGYRPVDVYYATDRARTGNPDASDFYGAGRGELEYGVVTVTIPNTHIPGAIETPSIWRLEFGPSPARHVMVQKIEPMEVDGYFSRMRTEMEGRERKEAVVFIHGFNTRFDAAARRAAQLAYDMDYRGIPVLYSWPSAGKTMRYVADEAVVRLSGRRLSHFLEDLRARSGAETIHIVAHSMGNRAATDALELLALRAEAKGLDMPLFGQLFFAAPDVDAGLFAEMAKTIRPLAERLTLYASENDWALAASRKLHGNAPRAGQAGGTILNAEDFDTVDMSDLGEDMLAHTYFANDSSALADIMSLIWLNPEPGRRCGLAQTTAGGWLYEKGACPDKKMVGLISRLWDEAEVTPEAIRAMVADAVPDAGEAEALERSFERLFESN